MRSKLVKIFLLLLLLCDFSWSFHQYYHTILDGDLAGAVLPNKNVQKVFDDPFGVKMLISEEPHANPNRVISHFILYEYFRTVPQFLQLFFPPVESLYVSCALIKLLLQILIVYLISSLIAGTRSIRDTRLLFTAVLITSLFQAYGHYFSIGIIDLSITYTFFYALPISLLLLFIWLFNEFILKSKKEKVGLLKTTTLMILAFIVAFTGSIVPPAIIIFSFLFICSRIFLLLKGQYGKDKNRISRCIGSIPTAGWIIGIFVTVLSLYSIFIGSYDNQFSKEIIPVSERYQRLLTGFSENFLHKSGFSSLFQFIGLNCAIILIFIKNERKKLIKLLITLLSFSAIYLALLPLGGYRPYRDLIIRYDSIMPITVFLFLLCGWSTLIIIQRVIRSKKWYQYAYLLVVCLFIFSYTRKDRGIKDDNACEKAALTKISESKEKIVALESSCWVLSWEVITDYHASESNGKLLKILGITRDEKMYYSLNPGDGSATGSWTK